MNPSETLATASQASFGRAGGRCDLIQKYQASPPSGSGVGKTPITLGREEVTSQLHRLGLGAQFFGQTPVQVLKSDNFKENCDVGGTCPSS